MDELNAFLYRVCFWIGLITILCTAAYAGGRLAQWLIEVL